MKIVSVSFAILFVAAGCDPRVDATTIDPLSNEPKSCSADALPAGTGTTASTEEPGFQAASLCLNTQDQCVLGAAASESCDGAKLSIAFDPKVKTWSVTSSGLVFASSSAGNLLAPSEGRGRIENVPHATATTLEFRVGDRGNYRLSFNTEGAYTLVLPSKPEGQTKYENDLRVTVTELTKL